MKKLNKSLETYMRTVETMEERCQYSCICTTAICGTYYEIMAFKAVELRTEIGHTPGYN